MQYSNAHTHTLVAHTLCNDSMLIALRQEVNRNEQRTMIPQNGKNRKIIPKVSAVVTSERINGELIRWIYLITHTYWVSVAKKQNNLRGCNRCFFLLRLILLLLPVRNFYKHFRFEPFAFFLFRFYSGLSFSSLLSFSSAYAQQRNRSQPRVLNEFFMDLTFCDLKCTDFRYSFPFCVDSALGGAIHFGASRLDYAWEGIN